MRRMNERDSLYFIVIYLSSCTNSKTHMHQPLPQPITSQQTHTYNGIKSHSTPDTSTSNVFTPPFWHHDRALFFPAYIYSSHCSVNINKLTTLKQPFDRSMAVASTIVPECFSGDIMRRSCTTSGNGCHRNTSSLFKNPMVSSEINILFPSVSFHQTRSSSMSSIHATASRSSCDSRFRQVVTDEKGDQRIAIDPGVDDEWKIRIPGCEGDNWKNEIGAYYKEMLIKIDPDNPLFMRNYGKFCGKYIPATSKELSKLHW